MLWMITDLTRTPSVSATVDSVVRVAAVGVDKVTVRNEGVFSEKELCAAVSRIAAKCPALRIFVSGSPDFAKRCGAHGIHLRSSALSLVRETRKACPSLAIAVSTHTPVEFEQAFADGADNAFYAPVFPPYSKPNDTRPTVAPVKRKGLFLLGGLDRGRAEGLIRQGFYDLAAISLFYSQTALDDVGYLSRLLNEVAHEESYPA
jgi:thiamine monophosphate synthase